MDTRVEATRARRGSPIVLVLGACAVLMLVLAGCSNSTSGTAAPQASVASLSSIPITTTDASATTTETATTTTTPTITAMTTTRDPDPDGAFDVAAAKAKIASLDSGVGTGPYNSITYYPDTEGGRPLNALYVLTADCSTGDGYCYQAFFFKGARYIGTATSKPVLAMDSSARAEGFNTVSLGYPQYAVGDSNAQPTLGVQRYNFTYVGGSSVQPSPPMPPLDQINGPGGH
jgi:LppP/LprE lipoprotein